MKTLTLNKLTRTTSALLLSLQLLNIFTASTTYAANKTKVEQSEAVQTEAAEGGVGHGGANSIGNELLDLILADNVDIKTTDETIASNEYLKNMLSDLDKIAYKVSSNFTSDKQWVFITNFNSKVSQSCENFSAIQYKDEKQIVRACQFKEKYILVDDDWFNSKKTSDRTRAATITHEIAVGKSQSQGLYDDKNKKSITEFDIQLFNGFLFKKYEQNQLTLESLQNILTKSHTISTVKLITPERYTQLANYYLEQKPIACQINANISVRNPPSTEVLNYIKSLSDVSIELTKAVPYRTNSQIKRFEFDVEDFTSLIPTDGRPVPIYAIKYTLATLTSICK